MSLQYNDTSTHRGIIQKIERSLGFTVGDISENATRLSQFTAEVNLALDKFTELAIRASGLWQYDDSSHTDYPIITTNLVDGQRSYSFTVDDNDTLILDIHKVAILPSATATLYQEITPTDVQTGKAPDILAGSLVEGVPHQYDKTANGIFLDPIPSYNAINGLKLYISREASYFTVADTTKRAGIPGLFHEYLALRAAYEYACGNDLKKEPSLKKRLMEYEGDEERRLQGSIQRYFVSRERDTRKVLTGKKINFI